MLLKTAWILVKMPDNNLHHQYFCIGGLVVLCGLLVTLGTPLSVLCTLLTGGTGAGYVYWRNNLDDIEHSTDSQVTQQAHDRKVKMRRGSQGNKSLSTSSWLGGTSSPGNHTPSSLSKSMVHCRVGSPALTSLRSPGPCGLVSPDPNTLPRVRRVYENDRWALHCFYLVQKHEILNRRKQLCDNGT